MVVGVSASALDDQKRAFLEAGLDDFLAKPIQTAELQAMLERHFPLVETTTRPPSLEGAPSEWLGSFQAAIEQGNMTKIGLLAKDAGDFSPDLARWLEEKATDYRIDDIKELMRARSERQSR